MTWFWKWLCLFAFRRWAPKLKKLPTGIPRHRDPENTCTLYEPRQRELGDFQECQSDGHYLCKECCHLKPEEEQSA